MSTQNLEDEHIAERENQRYQEGAGAPKGFRSAGAGTVGDSSVRRLESTAMVLFVVNLFFLYISYSMYVRDENLAYFATAVAMATAVILLLSLLFWTFGMVRMSRFALAVAILGTMISVVSFGANILDRISEWGSYW